MIINMEDVKNDMINKGDYWLNLTSNYSYNGKLI